LQTSKFSELVHGQRKEEEELRNIRVLFIRQDTPRIEPTIDSTIDLVPEIPTGKSFLAVRVRYRASSIDNDLPALGPIVPRN